MVELADAKDDPNILTTLDVGSIVVGMMLQLDTEYTMSAVELLSTPEHWTSEGFSPEDQPDIVKQVTAWTVSGPAAVQKLQDVMVALTEEESNSSVMMMEVMQAMPAAAADLARQRMKAHQTQRRMARRAKRAARFGTKSQQTMLVQLLHGVAATDGGAPDRLQQALSKGVPAKPETRLFAKWLSYNATDNAKEFQKFSFDYTGQSSSPLDAFNTQIQGMVKKISGFIDMMKQYSTPAGVEKLEKQAADFATKALDDVFNVVKDKVMGILE